MEKRIVIMAGGTGGHVFPALAVAKALQQQGWAVSWMGTHKGLESRIVPEQGIEMDWLSVQGVRGKGTGTKIRAVFKLLKACAEARAVLKQRHPDVVLGMGGFVAAPGGLMSRMLGIPLLIHEQNRVPGTTNRLLKRFACKVMEAFPGSFEASVGALFTGNPLRQDMLRLQGKAPRRLHEQDRFRILVFGGSQGAEVLNQKVPEALAGFENISVKHQTGAAMLTQVQQHYAKQNTPAEVMAFIDDMAAAYEWADMVICRSGAMTVSEVAAAGLPAIFVPLPHAIDDHQTANARYLCDNNAGVLMPQSEMTIERMRQAIKQIRADLLTMSQAARKKARFDATDAVVAQCIEEAGR
ncbi:undecaprenyldiphospho-muramoylpentapeptide beta-N-acetylglucosaminyltransferase [methane-oxidizing endosymbiont of Gigantopelta aegis]|uniref:undecaprenyldiphospho-muramoylpentapeptide beta-N-acetylglucosaminyltransferase n=1 Tax=methane-oxidizing endosymbiont of Gigantopelta aegis TaxID=2794938 RepID=UPI0018DB5EFE|nr:undecaprenyldiphospho-muramoylpentapeptide beta-N-acetylglucosaminyltransferase [methane-oxidizing endosymbiont of Gigantopelta aegis]